MADESAVETKPAKGPKAKKKNYYQQKVEDLQAENAALKANLEAATANSAPSPEVTAAVADHFDKIDGFVDEHDRAKLKHREQIEDAKRRGVDAEEVIEYGLDSSEVRAIGWKGKEWMKAHRLRWVNKSSRQGQRISYHKGKGFFFVRPSEHPVRPTHGIKEENTWILGENVLMAEPMDFFLRNRERALSKMLHQGADMREGTREQINALIRNETGQPHARPGITKSYRDNTWDKVEEGAPIEGPSSHVIPPTQ